MDVAPEKAVIVKWENWLGLNVALGLAPAPNDKPLVAPSESVIVTQLNKNAGKDIPK